MTVRKAVIPVAGFGTRFLPASRSVPKNVLPVFDRPSIHFSVEEAARAGIEHIIFIVSRNQEAVPRYFEPIPDLERALQSRGNDAKLDEARHISRMADIRCVTQDEQKGLGHAVLMARDAVGDEPFAVFLPDDVIWGDQPTIGGLIETHQNTGANVLAVKEVDDAAVPNLGIVDIEDAEAQSARIRGLVEKPRLEDAPSNLAIIGRYVLRPEIFETLERVPPGALGEIQLTDAIAAHIDHPGVYGYRFAGEHYDVGTPLGMLKASVAAALKRDDLAPELREWLREAVETERN